MIENNGKPVSPRHFIADTHFSYNHNLAYRPRPYKGNETIRGMIEKAEQVMTDHEFKA